MSEFSKKYQIYRWDPIIDKYNTKSILIYVLPDDEMFSIAKEKQNNNQYIVCKITDSNSIYDTVLIRGVFNTSAVVPNYRPNFFNATQYFVINLDSTWNGYPLDLGFVQLQK